MKIYSGAVWKDFIISLLAYNYTPQMVRSAFKEHTGRDDLSEELIATIQREGASDIELERKRILESFEDLDIASRINSIAILCEAMVKEGVEKKDARLVLAAIDRLLKSYEPLAKIEGVLKEKLEVDINHNVNVQMNIGIFKQMEEDGIISVKNEPELLKLLGQ